MIELDGTPVDPESAKQHKLARSLLPALGQPTVESTRYVLGLRASMTAWRELDGLPGHWGAVRKPEFWQADMRVDDNPERVIQFLSRVASRLAWLEVFAAAEITVKQSDLAMSKGRHYNEGEKDPTRQVLDGDRFSVGSVYYATGFDPTTGITLQTHEQIVTDGTLTPHMEEWLSRILHKDNRVHPSSSYLKPFAGWLRSKRPDLDIPDHLANE